MCELNGHVLIKCVHIHVMVLKRAHLATTVLIEGQFMLERLTVNISVSRGSRLLADQGCLGHMLIAVQGSQSEISSGTRVTTHAQASAKLQLSEMLSLIYSHQTLSNLNLSAAEDELRHYRRTAR